MRVLASWSSKGGKWTAELIVNPEGWRLAEKKRGHECGASWRPTGFFPNDVAAIDWACTQVDNNFDVRMRRMT